MSLINNEVKRRDPKPIQQGQYQTLVFTFSSAITSHTFAMYLIHKDTRIRAATYTIVIDEPTKTITGTLTDTVTAALAAKTYDWELHDIDASSKPSWLLKGEQIIYPTSTEPATP